MSVVTTSSRLLRDSLLYSTAVAAFVWIIGGFSHAQDQDGADDPANFAWQEKAIEHAQRMRGFFDPDCGQQKTPPVIPAFETDTDPLGSIATLQPLGPTQTSQNAFFANLGTNGRTCFSCHDPQNGCPGNPSIPHSKLERYQ